jgi:hypothetical protein
MKICIKCNKEKELEEFNKHPRMKDGHINKCKLCEAEYKRLHYKSNKEQYKTNHKHWQEENKEYCKGYKKQYAEDNEGHLKEYRAAWYQDNKHRDSIKANRNKAKAKRRATKLQATPIWSNIEFQQLVIEEAYQLRIQRTKETGIVWHVDHIIPLQGEKVCGLHVAENLQVITALENKRKNNTYHV